MSNYYRPAGFGKFSFFPPVIKNLIIINVAVFLIEMLGRQVTLGNGLSVYEVIVKYFALLPLGGITLRNGIGEIIHWNFYPWQLITYQFMHGGFWHIALNMFFLWMFGIEVENLWGSKKFLTFYLMCGIAAGISQLIFPPLLNESVGYTIGASGGIFGVLIAFAMLFPERYLYVWFLIPVKAKYLIAFFVVLEFFSINSPGSDIAHLAHLGGALAGFIYMLYEKKRGRAYGNYFSGGSSSSSMKEDILGKVRGVSDMFKKKDKKVEDAKFFEVKDGNKKEEEITQKEIDEILDKISQSGYQNLTEREKKILFEASKKIK